MRGEIVKMAGEISKQLKEGKEFPFKKVVMCNIGNPQALGQKPITFFRQVLALTEYPAVRAAKGAKQHALCRLCSRTPHSCASRWQLRRHSI